MDIQIFNQARLDKLNWVPQRFYYAIKDDLTLWTELSNGDKIVLKKFFDYGRCKKCGKYAHFDKVCKKYSIKPQAQKTCNQFFNKLKKAGIQYSVNVINQDNQTRGSQQRPPKQRGSNPKTRKPTKTPKARKPKKRPPETDTRSPWTRWYCECYCNKQNQRSTKKKKNKNTPFTRTVQICQGQCT